jgi:hypothetical protein
MLEKRHPKRVVRRFERRTQKPLFNYDPRVNYHNRNCTLSHHLPPYSTMEQMIGIRTRRQINCGEIYDRTRNGNEALLVVTSLKSVLMLRHPVAERKTEETCRKGELIARCNQKYHFI